MYVSLKPFFVVSFLLLISLGCDTGSGTSEEVPTKPVITEGGKIITPFQFKVSLGIASEDPLSGASAKLLAHHKGKKDNPGKGKDKDKNSGDPKHPKDTNFVVNKLEIDILRVEVNTEERGWEVINDSPQVLDLIELKSNAHFVLSDRRLEPGTYTQLRLILGENNSLIVNGESAEIKIPSAQKSGLKINLKEVVTKGFISDFSLELDLEKSLKRKGKSNSYNLKPLIKVAELLEDVTSPLISIINPQQGSIHSTANVEISVEYFDRFIDVNSFQITSNQVDITESFVVEDELGAGTVNFEEGIYTLSAKVSDFQPNTTVSDDVSIIVDLSAPLVNSSLVSNMLTNVPAMTIDYQVSDITKVNIEILLNNEVVKTTSEKNGVAYVVLQEGANQVEIRAVDETGRSTSKLIENIELDTIPAVFISKDPVESFQYFNIENNTFSLISYFNEKISYAVINGERIEGNQFSNGFSYSKLVNLSETFSVSGEVFDLAGNKTLFSATYEIVYDTISPVASFTAPDITHTNVANLDLSLSVIETSPYKVVLKRNNEESYEVVGPIESLSLELIEGEE